CHITGVPEDTFAVGEFSLQEGLSELFTLNLTLVRAGNPPEKRRQGSAGSGGRNHAESRRQFSESHTGRHSLFTD
ncbi:hypothetical protein, partial [Xenorhabdus entomophaga]|uniref:hypothetical protein n=1 Tax=Xenorhabdus entomophaga TaxID=3136257 RepID=UPI0030F4AC19